MSVLEQLADHLDELADQLEDLVTAGEYLWFRPTTNTFHASTTLTPPQAGDLYLFVASSGWVSQWAGDWDAAGLALVDALAATMADTEN